MWRPCRALLLAALATILVTLSSSCGPAVIVWGIAEIAKKDNETVFVLIFINNNGERIDLSVAGSLADGSPFTMDGVMVLPAGVTTLTVPPLTATRIRGCEMLAATTTRAPVTWDFDVATPTERTTATFGVESVVVGELSTTTPEQVQIQRLDSDAAQTVFTFTPVNTTDLPVTPDRVELHPSGGYAYLLRDLGSNMAEIQAFRIDAENRALEFIAGEFGSAPENPTGFAYSVDLAATDFVIDPLSRCAYVLDKDQAGSRTTVHVFRIEADGSLRQSGSFIRGFISSLVFRQNGRFVYVYEDTDTANNPGGEAFRAFEVDADSGVFSLLTGETAVQCGATIAPKLAVHPSSRFAYVTEQQTGNVIVQSYAIGTFGSITGLQSLCAGEFVTLDDLSFDPAGLFLYVTGTIAGGAARVIRYPIDPTTGFLGARDDSQDLGDLSNITSGQNPNLPAADPFKNIIYVAIGDTLVPHSRDSTTGVLTPVPGAPSLGFGDFNSTRLVTEARSGTVQVQTQ